MANKTVNDLYEYALSLYGTPYQWGGGHDGPLERSYGLDCSGLVRKILAFGKCEPKGDHTADDYYHYFLANGYLNAKARGALAFFGTTDRIHHIGFCLDEKILISASNGGSHVKTLLIAQKCNAKVLIEPISMRPDFVCCIMPTYSS